MIAPRRTFKNGLAAMPLATLPATLASEAELLRLGAEFELAWDRQAACERATAPADSPDDVHDALYAAFETAYHATSAIVDKIEGIKATTLDGVLVKLRACSWCHSGEPFDGSFLWDDPRCPATTDFRCAEGVLRDLLAIDGRPVPVVELEKNA